MSAKPARRILVFEGVPGAGKSVLSKKFLEHLTEQGVRCKLFPEKVPEDFLQLYLKSPAVYGFAFELYLLSERVNTMKEAYEFISHGGGIAIIDRGLVGSCAFAHHSDSTAKVFDVEAREIYDKILLTSAPWLTMKILHVYFPITPKLALARIKKRGNEGEMAYYTEKLIEDLDLAHSLCFDLVGPKIGLVVRWPRTIRKKTKKKDCEDLLTLLLKNNQISIN